MSVAVCELFIMRTFDPNVSMLFSNDHMHVHISGLLEGGFETASWVTKGKMT